ncbi:uncharacterized protein Z519_08137 [Cladophialophora bantiana CBS 173.52]|uniref:Uncharacterized protein n=1 Tax=Cladophialophora bantiana (strain ATCC 10958 / CBS 173.52 / CDC B-1940 / NIH 8579) TaxID=1442370 RepID=A0A0D2EMJ5_CLAB1|nr:uncharacterized protein Z519_08137 [Cladophialophora bantiana CBS 173.52]KIW91241.1 hypothetical protein Z519_08137 [Cladophialophora bantiana CBS 173.52]
MSTSHSSASTNETPARPKNVDTQGALRDGAQAQTDTPQALVEYGEYLGRCIAMADLEPATSQTGKKRKRTPA